MSHPYRTDPFGPPGPQTCGRCRHTFPGDRSLAQDLDSGWFSCPPCTDVLLGSGALAAVPGWGAGVVR